MLATILTAANQPERAITEIEHGRSNYESLYPRRYNEPCECIRFQRLLVDEIHLAKMARFKKTMTLTLSKSATQ